MPQVGGDSHTMAKKVVRARFQDQGCSEVCLERGWFLSPQAQTLLGQEALVWRMGLALPYGSWKKEFPSRSPLHTPVGPHRKVEALSGRAEGVPEVGFLLLPWAVCGREWHVDHS